jgi:hypothetical protein
MRLPKGVEEALAKLDPSLRQAFVRDYLRRRKLLLIAYLLWLLGWHYLYLGKIGPQLAFLLTVGGFLVWAIVDLFRLPGMVARYNEAVVSELLSFYGIGAKPMGGLPVFLT